MTTPSVGRLDHIVSELERLNSDAQEILNHHIDCLKRGSPTTPFGTLKAREILQPAGTAPNLIAALKIVRQRILSRAT
jgi:hypothetical protein